MAQRFTNSFISTVTPGAYPNTTVKSNPVGISATGVVAIIGEAEGGEDFSNEDLKANYFSPDQLSQVENKYIGGNLVEAFAALTAPSNDPLIQGSVSRVYLLKTNAGDKAQATLDTDYGTLKAANWGAAGNNTKYQVTASQAESAPQVTSAAIANFGAALNGASFSVRLNGGASTTITLSNTPADHSSASTLAIELNAQLPAGVSAAAGLVSATIVLTVAADGANYRKGWGKSLQLVDSTPTNLALLGLTAGLYKSGAESEIEISIARQDIGQSEIKEAKGEVALEVGYNGTTATLSISGMNMTTTVAGGSGANLSINMSNFRTIKDLADFISAQTGYSAAAASASSQKAPAQLDKVSAIGICATGASIRPGRIKKSLQNVIDAMATSALAAFTATEVEGLPSPMASAQFMSGGAKGATSGANIVDALQKLEGVAVNFVVPLFSRDASEDVADEQTDASSTYTIDSIHAAVRSHILKMSTPSLKRNRSAILSYKGAFADAQERAQTAASFRASMAFQDVDQVNRAGNTQTFQPWYGAVVASGMQAAGFYRGITNKYANVISYRDPSGFDSGSPGDVESALLSGLLILQADTAGVKWVSDQTTYGLDSNFVYNSIQAVYGSDIVALDLADSFQRQFVGQSLADVDAASALAFLSSKMNQYRSAKLITASDDAPLAYKNPSIQINGPVMSVSVEIKLSTSIYFIPISIQISQVQQTAGA